MLLSDFQDRYLDTEVGRLVSVHVSQLDSQSPLGRFFAENNLEVDSWYQALRYPESSKGQLFDHVALKYGSSSRWPGAREQARSQCSESWTSCTTQGTGSSIRSKLR